MPSRVVRGEINSSESLSQVSVGAELCFRALLLVVDDFGRCDGRLPVLKGALFPLREKATTRKISDWLQELAALPDPPITRYIVGGRPYIALTGWEKHRGKGRRAAKSKWPEPPESASAEILGKKENPPVGRGTWDVGRGTCQEDMQMDALWGKLVEAAARHGKSWRKPISQSRRKLLRARLSAGASEEDLVRAIDGAVASWGPARDDWEPIKHLVPETIYRPSHFDAYLEAADGAQVAGTTGEDAVAAYQERIMQTAMRGGGEQ